MSGVTAEKILTVESQKLLKDIVALCDIKSLTENTWKYMCLCFDCPRPSAKEEIIREALIKCAVSLGCSYRTDAVGNLAIVKPAAPGFETKTNIVIQAHMDMVCSKSDLSTHDFDTQRIPAKISDDKKWILSGDTTLGADDGIGVSAGMAVIEEIITKNIPLPQIVLLFTTEEETTMNGALLADPLILTTTGPDLTPINPPTVFLNVDSEELQVDGYYRTCIGCAGGGETKITKTVQYDEVPLNDFSVFKFILGGFNGGHSGVDIDKSLGNAIKIGLTDFIYEATQKFGQDVIRISSINGGNAVNAIPRNVAVTGAILKEKFQEVSDFFHNEKIPQIHNQYATVEAQVSNPGITTKEDALSAWKPTLVFNLVVTDAESYKVVQNQPNLLKMAMDIPHGVIDWSKVVVGFPETSNSFSIVQLQDVNTKSDADSVLLYHCFFRSTIDSALDTTVATLKQLAEANNFDASDMFNSFPGWQPRSNENPLFKATEQACLTTFNQTNPQILQSYVIHAGLEVGCLSKIWPNVISASIGPTITAAHSFYEKIDISTVEPFCNWLWNIIVNLSKVEAKDFEQFV